MKISDNEKLWLGDVKIPTVFITEYLPRLSPSAVKLYLFAKYIAQNQISLDADVLLKQLCMKDEEFKNALLDLAKSGAVSLLMGEDNFSLNDLKSIQLDRAYVKKSGRNELQESILNSPEQKRKNEELETRNRELQQVISDRFYHGLMTLTISRIIEKSVFSYEFDEGVVYALFSEMDTRGKLNHSRYIEAVASAWKDEGVKSFADLQVLSKRKDEVRRLAKRVGKKLNIRIGEAEENMVRRWKVEFGYDYSVIAMALEKSINAPNAGLNYFNAILSSWNEAGLRNAAEIKVYEEENALKREREKSFKKKAEMNRGYERRTYTDEALDSLFWRPDAVNSDEGGEGGEEKNADRDAGTD